jgi:SAM-dependent methyltransferase
VFKLRVVLRSLRRVIDRGDVGWLQPLPTGAPVDRRDLIVAAARGKRVIHLGFTDERQQEAKQADERWLHAALAAVASHLVGLDVDAAGVELARAQGYESHIVDLQDAAAVAALSLEPADLVVAGEIIEHVDAPGPFLRAVRPLLTPGGRLLVTTPNAYRTAGVLAPLLGGELIHPDHVGIHSIHTLRTLAERAGYDVVELGYYQNTPVIRGRSAAALAVRMLRAVQARLARRLPHWSDGIYAVLTVAAADARG